MVLPLKRWKSRASPGIAAGAHDLSDLEEPIHNSKGGPLSFIRRMSAFFRFAVLKQKAFGGAGWSSPPPFCESKTGNKKGFRVTEMLPRWWRGMEQPGSSSGS